MRAGELRALLLVQSPTRTVDAGGGATVSWDLTSQMYAKVETADGREFQSAKQLIPALTHVVTTRYRDDILPTMRLSNGKAALQIHAVFDPDGKQRELRIYCSQIKGDVITISGAANLVPGDIELAGTGTLIIPAVGTLAPGNPSLGGQGTLVIPAAGTLAPGNPAVGGTGTLIIPGAGTMAPGNPILGGTGSVDTLVADLIAAGLTVPAYYDTRYNVLTAPSSSAIACAWDDKRASTHVGRVTNCNVASAYVDCANYTGLDAATKATITARGIAFTFASIRVAVSRWGTANGNRQFIAQISTAAKMLLTIQSGGTNYTWTGNDTLTAGTLYDMAWKYDGTQGTDLAKVACRYRSFDPTTQTWGAWANDTGASVTAGFAAAMITGTTQTLQIGRQQNIAGGQNQWYGLLDDIQIHPGVVLTDAQITSAFGMNPADADWHAPSIWHDLTSMTNRGSTGSANNGTLTGDLNLCSDDTAVAHTMLCGGGTASPAWDSVNKVITLDALDDFMRCVGGPLTGITQDMAVVVVGVSPQSGVNLVTVSVGSTSDALKLSKSTTNLRATSSTVTADIANATGTRAYMARRTGTGTVTVGNKNGTASEVTASGAIGNFVPTTITIGADRASTPANFGDCAIKAVLVIKGDLAGHQSIISTWAHTFCGASV